MQNICEIWERIEDWLKLHAPEAMRNLNPGATKEDIHQLEKKLGYQIPDDVKESLLVHNGTRDIFADIWQILDIENIIQQQHIQADVLESLQQEESDARDKEREIWWWHPSWIPIAYDGSGNLLCVEAEETHSGQIFRFDHELGSRWIAPTFLSLLATFADDLRSGKYILKKEGRLQSQKFLFARPQEFT